MCDRAAHGWGSLLRPVPHVSPGNFDGAAYSVEPPSVILECVVTAPTDAAHDSRDLVFNGRVAHLRAVK